MLDNLVTIQLDKERHLRLPLKGMIEFEKLTGKSLLKGFTFKDLSLEDTAAMLWASLIHEDKELTFDDVLLMVDFGNLAAVMSSLATSLSQSMPATKEGDRPLAKKPRRG